MKRINKWIARDGSEFTNEESAKSYEDFLDKVDYIKSFLPMENTSTDFANGNGYIQHIRSTILRARESLVSLSKEYVFSEIDQYNIRDYAFVRYLDDNNSVLYSLYLRIVLCIDDSNWREYGQPYFANNPHEAKQIQVG